MPKAFRYPGTRPFERAEQQRFKGRDADSQRLYEQVLNERSVLLYAKSGLGKSSLINAGLMPKIEAGGHFLSIAVRFNNFNPQAERNESPLDKLSAAVEAALGPERPETAYLDRLIPQENSLWYRVKRRWPAGEAPALFFVFDQFEEAFTHPEEAVFFFKKELAALFSNEMPKRFRTVLDRRLRQDPEWLSAAEKRHLSQPIGAKALFAIRSDRMSALNQMADYFPDILKSYYELLPLSAEQARSAIAEPATLPGDFASPPFQFSPAALDKIIGELNQGGTQPLESFQIQMVCRYVEDQVLAGQIAPQRPVAPGDLGDLSSLFGQYYQRILAGLPDEVQDEVRELIEEKLIVGGVRVPLPEAAIVAEGLPAPVLEQLLDTHFLRAERNSTGGRSIELAHDTLIGPVSAAYALRRTAEERAFEEAARRALEGKLAAERAEKARQRRQLLRVRGLLLLTALALVAALAGGYYALSKEQAATEALGYAQMLNMKNQRLVNAFYFYDGRLALAYKNTLFGFINKAGEVIIPYAYEQAEQFDELGFAKVRKYGEDFLVDAEGREYPVAYSLMDIQPGITALDLRGKQIDGFPSGLPEGLEVLIMDGDWDWENKVLPQIGYLARLKALRVLSLAHCGLRSVPAEVLRLKHLERLNLDHNPIGSLPQGLAQLTKLRELRMGRMPEDAPVLGAFPAVLLALPNLEKLDLAGHQIPALPDAIGSALPRLQWLNLDHNALDRLPESFMDLSELRWLNLQHNGLSAWPERSGLPNLHTLLLYSNGLQQLPPSFFASQHLYELDLSDNRLAQLPADIDQLKQLGYLNIRGNPIERLPESIGELGNLSTFYASGCGLAQLPESLGQLHQLGELDLGNNALSRLPESIGQLASLRSLILNENQLERLPESIGELERLEELDALFNRLEKLPESIGQLQRLQRLILDSNQLRSLPESIGQLKGLRFLGLRDNPLPAATLESARQKLPDTAVGF